MKLYANQPGGDFISYIVHPIDHLPSTIYQLPFLYVPPAVHFLARARPGEIQAAAAASGRILLLLIVLGERTRLAISPYLVVVACSDVQMLG